VITGITADGASTLIGGTLNTSPGGTYTIELFGNVSNDPSGYGEGQAYLAQTSVTTDASGNGTFSVSVPAVSPGLWITATATDAGGNTSEFSLAVAAPGAPFTLDDVGRALRIMGGALSYAAGDDRLDVVSNGKVDAADVARICRKVAGLEANP